jgi:hypothetical protein
MLVIAQSISFSLRNLRLILNQGKFGHSKPSRGDGLCERSKRAELDFDDAFHIQAQVEVLSYHRNNVYLFLCRLIREMAVLYDKKSSFDLVVKF